MHISLAPSQSLRQVVAHGLIGASIAFAAAFLIDAKPLARAHDDTTLADPVRVDDGASRASHHDVSAPVAVQPLLAPTGPARVDIDGLPPIRMVTEYKQGRVVGTKLFSIQPGSVFERVGLKNGDVVTSVNGFRVELTDPASGLELYTKLKGARIIVVDILRRGQPVKLTVDTSAFDSALIEK